MWFFGCLDRIIVILREWLVLFWHWWCGFWMFSLLADYMAGNMNGSYKVVWAYYVLIEHWALFIDMQRGSMYEDNDADVMKTCVDNNSGSCNLFFLFFFIKVVTMFGIA